MDPNEEEEILTPESAPADPAPEEPEVPEAPEPDAPSQDEEDPEADPEPSSTGSRRLDKRIERFSMKLRNEAATRQTQPSRETYKPADLSDMEYDPETLRLLEEDRRRVAEDAFTRGAGERAAQVQERFMDRFEVDADRVTTKYSQMDEDSSDFDPELAADLNEKFLALVGYDERTGLFHRPIMRYKDFIDAEMATLERYASSRNADAASNVAKQASRTGVRPGGSGRRTTLEITPEAIHKMTPEEYEKHRPAINAYLAQHAGDFRP